MTSIIKCNRIDHYTLIVPDARSVSEFHKNVLGYSFLDIKEVNAGSVPKGSYDMVNYIHEWPDGSGRVLVITEGLTDESIFRRFMAKYGAGIHHVALQVDDLDEAWRLLESKGIKVTSAHIMYDFLSGLKQLFLDNEDTGVFIELIERKKNVQAAVDATQKGFFTHDNMAGLAGTMSGYIEDITAARERKENPAGMAMGRVADVRLREFILEVPDPQKTAAFFVETFGFLQEHNSMGEVRIYLESEPDLCFVCRPKTMPLINHSVVCHGSVPVQLLDVFKTAATNTMVLENGRLNIAPSLSGYPMEILYS